MKKKILRILFSCILSLFISILALALGLSHFAKDYVCNKAHIQSICETSNFTKELYEEIRYDWENLVSITGITEQNSILSVLTPQMVKNDATAFIISSYTGNATLNTETLRANLETKVREYASSHNINATPDAELEKNITDLVDACIEDYRMSVSIPTLPKILGNVSSLSSYLDTLILFAAVGIMLLLLFLLFIQRKKQDVFYYISVSGVTNAILLIGAMHLAGYYEIISRLPFADSALKTLISDYLQSLVNVLEHYGYCYLFVAFVCMAVYLIIQPITVIVKRAKFKVKFDI